MPASHPRNALPEQFTRAEIAVLLRHRAGDRDYLDGVVASAAITELMHLADLLDGGVGADVHHGCPDVNVPTAQCTECALVLSIEAPWSPSVFSLLDGLMPDPKES